MFADVAVVYPTRFLEAEDAAHNFLFNVSLNRYLYPREDRTDRFSPTRSCLYLYSIDLYSASADSSRPVKVSGHLISLAQSILAYTAFCLFLPLYNLVRSRNAL